MNILVATQLKVFIQMIGKEFFTFFHKMVSNWTTLDIEYRCMHDNGTFLDLEMKGTPIKSPDGEIQVITVSRDITLRKRAEEELRQTTMKLKTLVSSLPYGVMVEDEEGCIVLHNDACSNIFTITIKQACRLKKINHCY